MSVAQTRIFRIKRARGLSASIDRDGSYCDHLFGEVRNCYAAVLAIRLAAEWLDLDGQFERRRKEVVQ